MPRSLKRHHENQKVKGKKDKKAVSKNRRRGNSGHKAKRRGDNKSEKSKKPKKNSIWKRRVNKKPSGIQKREWRHMQWEKEKEAKRNYQKHGWFWGMVSQMEAEDHLRESRAQTGEFLVRSIQFDESTTMIITVSSMGGKEVKEAGRNHAAAVVSPSCHSFSHLKAFTSGAGWYLEDMPRRHRTLVELIKYYRRHPVGAAGVKLLFPAKQPDWMLKRHEIIAPEKGVVLGAGQFGSVVVGCYRRRLVAVKMLKCDEKLQKDRDSLMKEAMIMKKLEHPYITKMIGVSLDKKPLLLVVEIMACGLDSHLRKHGKATSLEEKLLYCLQISKGMAHMAKLRIVHRDLAARNVLFSRYGILKISDFGMSDMETKLLIVNLKKEQLPKAWMAPESLADANCATFTEKTDVWSFAVTCGEIFENAQSPATPMVPSQTEKRKIEGREETAVPKDISDFLFKDLVCLEPDKRPTFQFIVATLQQLTTMKYFPPPVESLTVRKIKNVHPLTMAEYEVLYANNLDWLPPVRKGRHKKKDKRNKAAKAAKKKRRAAKIAKMRKKNPRRLLKKLRRRLRRRRKKLKIRRKLMLMRRLRTEEKTRVRLLRVAEATNPAVNHALKRKTQFFKSRLKIVLIYRNLMHVKFRKRAPTRQTRFRLRPRRRINKMAKHPMSRNRKGKTVKSRKSERRKKVVLARPVFPNIKALAKRPTKYNFKKEIELKKKTQRPKIKRVKSEIMVDLKEKKRRSGDRQKEEELRMKKRLKRRKRRNHFRKRVLRRRRRKRHRMERRHRRLRRRRLRHRRMKRKIRRRALTMPQKDKMSELNRRRRHKRREMHRRKRVRKIARILLRWSIVRRLMRNQKMRQTMRRKARNEEKLKRLKVKKVNKPQKNSVNEKKRLKEANSPGKGREKNKKGRTPR